MIEQLVEYGKLGSIFDEEQLPDLFKKDISQLEVYRLSILSRRDLLMLMNFLEVRISSEGMPLEAMEADEMRMEYLLRRKRVLERHKNRMIKQKKKKIEGFRDRCVYLVQQFLYEPLKYK